MKLSPMDVNNRQFSKSMRGYNTEEVDGFLQHVSQDMEELVQENVSLSKEVKHLRESLADLKEREKILKDTMLLAQQTKEEIKTNALKEAEIIIHDSELNAEKIMRDAHLKVEELKKDVDELTQAKAKLLVRIENIMSRTSDFIETLRMADDPEE